MALNVITENCTSIGSNNIYANAIVDTIDTEGTLFTYFEYKKTLDTLYNTTAMIMQEGVGSYNFLIEGLENNTFYDVVAVVNDGTTTVKGAAVQVQTLTNLSARTANNYDDLIAKTIGTLQTELENKRITTDYYAKVLLSTIQQTMQLSYTMAVKEGTIDESEILLQKQIEEVQARIDLTKTQKEQLILSVLNNNKIHTLDSLTSMIGTGMAGQVIVEQAIFQEAFNQMADLLDTTAITVSANPATAL